MNHAYIKGVVVSQPHKRFVEGKGFVVDVRIETGYVHLGKSYLDRSLIRIPESLLKVDIESLYGKNIGGFGNIRVSQKNKLLSYIEIVSMF